MKLTFESTTDADLGPLLSIYNHYVVTDTATFHTQALDESEFRKILFPAYTRFQSWTVRVDDEPAGYAILARYKPREAYDGCAEVTLYLKPELAGRGVGSDALAHLEQQARERGFHTLLAIVCGENSASIRLFEKHSYQKCAHYHQVGQKFGRWLDVVSYEKLLDHSPTP